MTRKRKRELNFQEQALWETVTRSVKPLVVRKPLASPPVAASAIADKPTPLTQPKAKPNKAGQPAGKSQQIKPAIELAPVLPPMVTMIRRERRAVVRGVSHLDAKLDLHGMRQDEAQRHLRSFLLRSAAAGCRTVLVVTGKGAPVGDEALWRPGEHSRGVLRRLAPLLLESAELRDIVLGYEPADKRHGGSGALYVRLRRRQA